MQIHISWKALLAGFILVIGLGLLLRTATLFLGADETAVAVASPSPTMLTASTGIAGGEGESGTATPLLAESPTSAPTATPTAEPTTTTPPATATSIATATTAPSPQPTLPPASPTPFLPPTREPTPMPNSLVISAQGFGQRAGLVSYAFVVENPNPGLVAQSVRYQVAVYDASGIVLSTDTDTIAQIGPGQRMGVAKELTLASNLIVSRIEVLLRPGQFVQGQPLQMLQVSNAAFVEGNPPNLTGLLNNPFTRDLGDLEVIGIAYDDVGVVGGGSVILPFVPANGQAPVSIPIATSQQATRVEFYASINAGP